MSKKDALLAKGVRGKKMLLKLGIVVDERTKNNDPLVLKKKGNSSNQAGCSKTKQQNGKLRILKRATMTPNNPENLDFNIKELSKPCSSAQICESVKSKTSTTPKRTTSIEALNLLDLISDKKYHYKRSLSMSDLTQDTVSFTQNIRRCESAPSTFKFQEYASHQDKSDALTVFNEPNIEADDESDLTECSESNDNNHDEPDLTVCSEANDSTVVSNNHQKSVLTDCIQSNSKADSFRLQVRSLSLNDLTEDKRFDDLLSRKCRSAPIIIQSSTFSRPCSPSVLMIYQDAPIPENNDDTESNHESSTENTDNVDFGNPSEGRKRRITADPTQWKKNVAKKQRMLGEAYLGYRRAQGGKVHQDTLRPSREVGPTCNSDFCQKSKLRGCQRFTDQVRNDLNIHFWKILNWDTRKIFVIGLVSRQSTSRKTKATGEKSKRGDTLSYFLPLKISDHEEKVQVCRAMFLSTLSLGRYTVQQWVQNANLGMIPNKDVINATVSKSKPSEVTRKLLTLDNFLNNIPKLPSHYARKDSTKLFLEPTFSTVTDLFNNYKEYCTLNEEPAVSRFTFDQKFREKNLSLYTLKKDMCDICSKYKAGNLNEADYQIHCIKKDRARKEKEEDKKKAANGEFILLTMDLEAVKVCPYLTASALYFKTKLTCHNFTVYDLTTHHCSCYWFSETEADLTANTFASFLINYLERHCVQRQLPIIIYSDGCTYQNRNAVLSNALLNFSNLHNVIIIQKFLEPGHTQMECDSVHSAIERKLKNKEIYLPSDYIRVTKEARPKNPYETISVDFTMIKNYADSSKLIYKNIRPGKKAGDPQVVDLRQIMYKPDFIIKVSLNFDSDWEDLPQRPRARVVSNVAYNQLHKSKIPIKKTKFDHLQQLKAVIPQDCHNFYDSLPYN